MSRRLPFAAALLLAAATVHAGGMRSEGDNQLTLALKLDYGERFFDRESQRVDSGCPGTVVASAAYERGLSYYHTAFVRSGVKHSRCGNAGTRLEDVELGVRGRVDPLDDRYVWEASLYLPASRWTGGSLDRESGSLGANVGIHVDNVPDPYASFLDPETHAAGKFGYGFGLRGWTEHLPNQAWGYLAYSKLLKSADWLHDSGGWWLYTRLDAKHSFGREHRTRSDNGLDIHDRYWLLGWSGYLSRQIKPWQVLTVGLRWDLAGRNISDGSGIAAYYSWNWRD